MRLALLLALLLCLPATHGSTYLSADIEPDGTNYYRDAVTSTTAVAVTFPRGAFRSVSVENESDGESAEDLLVKFIRSGEAVAAEELSVPTDETWSEVQVIPAATTITFEVSRSEGLIYDRASGTGAMTIRVLD